MKQNSDRPFLCSCCTELCYLYLLWSCQCLLVLLINLVNAFLASIINWSWFVVELKIQIWHFQE